MCAWGVIVAFMRIGLGYTKSEEGHGKELEGILEGGAVSDLWQERILRAGFSVGWRFEGSKCAFDCVVLSIALWSV